METVIGYYWEGGKQEIPIIKKDDNKYYRVFPKTAKSEEHEEEFERERFQYAMTNPWDSTNVFHEQVEDKIIVSYNSPIYDCISCRIIGEGSDINKATFNLIENILDVMYGYNEEKVEKFMDNAELECKLNLT